MVVRSLVFRSDRTPAQTITIVTEGWLRRCGSERLFKSYWVSAVTTVLPKAAIALVSASVLLRSIVLPLHKAKMEIDICPRWVLARLRVPQQTQHHVALLVSTLLTLAVLPLVTHIPHFCLMQKVLGIPCPGCGISHSVMALLRLKFGTAWQSNPAGVGVASVFCFQLVARPIAITAPRTGVLVSQVSRHMSNVALGSLLLVWVSRLI
jgi:hypothetical protein